MNNSEEWKSIWPILSSHGAPLLLQSQQTGPLFFNPNSQPKTLNPNSLSNPPNFLSPPPHLSLPRFIQTSANVLPSTASSIATAFHPGTDTDTVRLNFLEPLTFFNNNNIKQVVVFFPTGSNLDQVGFFVLSNSAFDSSFTCNVRFHHRIVSLRACSVVGDDSDVGFLLASSLYAVHWFVVRVTGCGNHPGLVYLGCKLFKSCAVACACWNPHLTSECLVLLQSGELFLFDVNSSCVNGRFRGKRIGVSWDGVGGFERGEWLSCEFSWHPRILVVASSKGVYLLDCRTRKCQPSCLLSVAMLVTKDSGDDEGRFVTFSKAGPDGFFFTVASMRWLYLCDVRKPLMPVVTWAHCLLEPRCMTVLPLSQLRSHPSDDKYVKASELGFAIILGSFWSNDFSLFCYGRPPPGFKQSCSTKISKFSNSFYAWELPLNFSLQGQDCPCGSCILREEFMKDDLPEWIEWQQKKELVLGFFILDESLSLLPQRGDHGGFTLVRLMSSGKLEMQHYYASPKMATIVATTHQEMRLNLKKSLLCSMGDEVCKIPKRYKYLKFEYLYAHLNDDLTQVLFSKFRNTSASTSERKGHDERVLKFLSEKLNSFGCDLPITHLSASDIFGDVNIPTSLNEIVCRVMWLQLPMDILEMAFSNYNELREVLSDHKKLSLDFPVIPDKNQSPPFLLRNPSHRSNKWSSKEKPSDDFVGPVVSLPASLVLSEISTHGVSFIRKINEFSPEKAFAQQYKSVVCLAKEMGALSSFRQRDKPYVVSLMDDREETWVDSSNPSPFFCYKPSAFQDELDHMGVKEEHDDRFSVMIAKLHENEKDVQGMDEDALKLFDDLSPVDLKFDDHNLKVSGEELRAYKLLKTQISKWQDGFIPYQNLLMRLRPQPPDVKP